MNDIAFNISESIKQAKWLLIEYQKEGEKSTSFWCAIKSIDAEKRILRVDAYNINKHNETHNGLIYTPLHFEYIIKAELLQKTTYSRPADLIRYIEANLAKLDWLHYDLYNDNVLTYLKACVKYDTEPYKKNTDMISGINDDEIMNAKIKGKYTLSLEQMGEMVRKIEKLSKQDKKKSLKVTDLVMNMLSIVTTRGLYVVAYKHLSFNPSERSLILSEETEFNEEFSNDEKGTYKHSLKSYLDLQITEFMDIYSNSAEEARNVLQSVLRRGEQITDEPMIFDLVRKSNQKLYRDIDAIAKLRESANLPIPIKAFFGGMTSNLETDNIRKRDIVIYNEYVNFDQLRVIHNALNNPITYVQGPPGTGKTSSIVNLLISSFFNKQTVLVTSNNNKPIDDIYKKITEVKYKESPIPFPVLRLGNDDNVRRTISEIKKMIDGYSNYLVSDANLAKHELRNKGNFSKINNLIDEYEKKIDLEEEIITLESFLNGFGNNFHTQTSIPAELDVKKNNLKKMENKSESEILENIIIADNTFFIWLYFTSVKYIKKLKTPIYEDFMKIIYEKDIEKQVKEFNKYTSISDNMKKLLSVFPIILSTNQSAYRLGEPEPIFDLVIIDEAGQCSIGYSLLPIIRGYRLLLVGDHNQLQPVISLSQGANKKLMQYYHINPSYNYNDHSILKTMQEMDSFSKFILLRTHYRCRKEIVDFCNMKYYDNELIIKNKNICDYSALGYLDIKQDDNPHPLERNVSKAEVEAIISDIKENNYKDIGIVTPFRNQAEYLKEAFSKEETLKNVTIGTVHTFQGDEKEAIYLSAAINKHSLNRTYNWLKNNHELINVAVTRAKDRFVFVGDINDIKRRSDGTDAFFELMNYVVHKGSEVEISKIENSLNHANYKQYNSKKEKELFKVINHLLEIEVNYKVEKQVKISSVLSKFNSNELFDFGKTGVFDFVVFKKGINDIPVFAIELNGNEHETDPIVIERDLKKQKICDDNNLKLEKIGNDYSRRYHYIKNILEKILST
ncbi:MAG: DNA2/NAM7 family helicase [Firmicutes bacterium]|nr:DNA2/NAM7 family helicase [Bacillota bacterium]